MKDYRGRPRVHTVKEEGSDHVIYQRGLSERAGGRKSVQQAGNKKNRDARKTKNKKIKELEKPKKKINRGEKFRPGKSPG